VGRAYLAGCGTVTAALSVGGATNSGISSINTCEKWNGSIWTITGTLSSGVIAPGTVGTVSSALCIGGYNQSSNIYYNQNWNGSSWSTANAQPTLVLQFFAVAGIPSNALAFGGVQFGSATAYTLNWNGSAWLTLSSLLTQFVYQGGCGTYTSALCVGGSTGPSFVPSTSCEKWLGSVWTTISSLNAIGTGNACGDTNNALAINGSSSNSSEVWNGFNWAISSSYHILNSDSNFAVCGTYNAALAFGGNTGSSYINSTEIWILHAYNITGTVIKDNINLTSYTVYLIDRNSGILVATTNTNGSGLYSFIVYDNTTQYQVITLDTVSLEFNAVIQSRVVGEY